MTDFLDNYELENPSLKGVMKEELAGGYITETVKPLEYFEKGSFRWIRSPRDPKKELGAWLLVGCPKGKYDRKTGKCKVGMELAELRKPIKSNKTNENPLLMVLPNSSEIPKSLLKKYEELSKKFPDFYDALKQYYEQHGTYPKKITIRQVDVGPKDEVTRMSLVALGETSQEWYTPNVESRKGKGQEYVHYYKRKRPLKLTDAKGKMIFTLPEDNKELVKRGWITY